MSIGTLTFYEVYWCFRNWQRIKARSGDALSPFWRAFFAPLWCFGLFGDVRAHAEAQGVGVAWSAGLLAATFFVLSVTWRLPDPWWLVSFGSFLPFLPVVRTVEQINASVDAAEGPNATFSWMDVLALAAGGVFLLLGILGTLLPE